MGGASLPPLALAYHGVSDVRLRDDPEGLFVRPEDLRRHVGRLRSWGYRLVTFGELAGLVGRGQGAGHAALTFDDGFVDNLTTLAPLARELELPATVFVVSGWLGQPHPSVPWSRMVTEEELRDLHAAGVEIGSHSVTHADLSSLSYQDARSELEQSKQELERILGLAVDVAAYPYGRANDETIRACRDAGYRAACRCTGLGTWADPHDLPREDMDNGCTLVSLRLKRDGRYEPLMAHRSARVARRVLRQLRAAV